MRRRPQIERAKSTARETKCHKREDWFGAHFGSSHTYLSRNCVDLVINSGSQLTAGIDYQAQIDHCHYTEHNKVSDQSSRRFALMRSHFMNTLRAQLGSIGLSVRQVVQHFTEQIANDSRISSKSATSALNYIELSHRVRPQLSTIGRAISLFGSFRRGLMAQFNKPR